MPQFYKLLQFSKWRWCFALLLASFFLLLRFWPMVVGKTLIFGDNYSLMVPGKLFVADWLQQGIIPLWNPHAFGGLPLAGDINQSLWYPSTVLFALFPAALALNLTVVSHQLIAFSGAFGLVWQLLSSGKLLVGLGRNSAKNSGSKKTMQSTHFWLAVLAGLLWMFSPQVTGAINNLATMQSIVWLPMIVWAGLQLQVRISWQKMWLYAGLVAVLLTIQFAGGYPQHVLFSSAMAFGCSLWWQWWPRDWRWWSGWWLAAVLTIGLSAWLWMPFQATLADSTRTLQSPMQAGAGSLHPADLVKIIIPYFFDHPSLGMKWGPQWNSMPNVALYVSWLGLLVLGVSLWLRRWQKFDVIMATLIGLTVIFAFGERLPLLAVLQQVSSVFRFSRGPSTILMITTLWLVIWIIRWLWALVREDKVKQKHFSQSLQWHWVSWLSIAALVLSGGFWLLIQYNFELVWKLLVQLSNNALAHSAFHTFERDKVILLSITSNAFWNSLALLVAMWALLRRRLVLLVLVIGVEMIYNTCGLFFFAPDSVYKSAEQLRETPVAQLLKQVPSTERILIRNYNQPYTDFGAYWEALTVRPPFSDSYIDAVELAKYQHLQRLGDGLTPAWNTVAGVSSINGYTTLLPIDVYRVWSEIDKPVPINNLPPIPLTNAKLTEWAVGYYLVDTQFDVTEDLRPIQLVASQSHWQLYTFPHTMSRFRYDTHESVQLTKLSETPNQIKLTFTVPETSTASALVIADRFDPNWHATVNGRPITMTGVEYLRHLPIKTGLQEVVMTYMPAELYLGGKVSVISLAIWLMGYFFWRKTKVGDVG